jgi:hypothetical protein
LQITNDGLHSPSKRTSVFARIAAGACAFQAIVITETIFYAMVRSLAKRNYKIRYGKPPVKTRWKPAGRAIRSAVREVPGTTCAS